MYYTIKTTCPKPLILRISWRRPFIFSFAAKRVVRKWPRQANHKTENTVHFLATERAGNHFQPITVHFTKDKAITITETRDLSRSHFGEIYVVFLPVLKVEMQTVSQNPLMKVKEAQIGVSLHKCIEIELWAEEHRMLSRKICKD